jgi:hypothetical protein
VWVGSASPTSHSLSLSIKIAGPPRPDRHLHPQIVGQAHDRVRAVLCCTHGYQQRVIERPFWRWLIRHAAVGDVRRASYDAISDTSPLGAGRLNLDGDPVLLLNKRDKSSEERREGGESR